MLLVSNIFCNCGNTALHLLFAAKIICVCLAFMYAIMYCCYVCFALKFLHIDTCVYICVHMYSFYVCM